MKNILIIPSWYPTKEAPYLGIFFKEQAILLSEEYEIVVLVEKPLYIGRKKTLKYLLKSNKFYTTPTLQNPLAEGNYKEYLFSYPFFAYRSLKNQIKITSKYYLKAIADLAITFDLIHAQSNLTAGMIASEIVEKLNCKLLITEHLPLILNNFNYSIKESYFNALKKADCVSTVSEHTRAQLIDNIPKSEVINHGNLIDENLFTLKKEQDKRIHKIGWVGSLYYRKDPFTFLRVMKEIQKRNISCHATMVFASQKGEININEINEFIKNEQLKDVISIQFSRTREELIGLYHSINALICTSISETFGIATLEAMFCGVPVVATRNGGIEDFINNDNGILCDIGDHHAISEAIISIIEGKRVFDPKKVRESVIHKYGKVAFTKRLKGFYEETIQLNKPKPQILTNKNQENKI